MFRDTLMGLHACKEAVDWVGDRTLEQAWRLCERGDWMLWLAVMAGVDRRLVVRVACDCARIALVHAGEDRPRLAIETAERWCDGRATLDEVCAAARAARAAAWAVADAAAWDAAWDAAWAAAAAAEAAAYAARAAAEAAAYAAYAAAEAAAYAAEAATLRECARLVRARIPFEIVAQAMNREAA